METPGSVYSLTLTIAVKPYTKSDIKFFGLLQLWLIFLLFTKHFITDYLQTQTFA